MPILPSSADVQTVSPRVARDPGVRVPKVEAPEQAFDSPVGIAAQELAPALDTLGKVAKQQEDRRHT